jgi:hypothetical protein
MMRKAPEYTHGFIDRHGKPRYYFRRAGRKQVPLPGMPWSPEFMAAYEAATKGDAAPRVELGANRTVPGTVAALVVAYFNSGHFLGLSPSTKATYRGIIERFRNEHGHRRVAHLQHEKLVEMLGNRSATTSAANNWLRMVRMLMRFAIKAKIRTDDPTLGIKTIKSKMMVFRFGTPIRSRSTAQSTRLAPAPGLPSNCSSTRRSGVATLCAWVASTFAMAFCPSDNKRPARWSRYRSCPNCGKRSMPWSLLILHSSLPNMANPLRPRALAIGSVNAAMRPASRRATPHTDYVRRRQLVWPRSAALTIRSWRGVGGRR